MMRDLDSPNGTGSLAGLPTWARALVQLVFQHGLSAVIALLLLWWVTGRISGDVDDLKESHRTHAESSIAMQAAFAAFSSAQAADTRALLVVTRQLCINTSKTYDQRLKCIQ